MASDKSGAPVRALPREGHPMFTILSAASGRDAGRKSSWIARAASDVIVIAGIVALLGVISFLLPDITARTGVEGIPSTVSTNLSDLPYYALRSVFRMFVALFFSLVFTFVYGLAAARNRRLRAVLIPLLDILQSVPILGFLSATITIWLVLFPNSILGVEAASVFAIFTSQAWNMTFSFYQSLRSEPKELQEMARSMRLTRWQRFWKLDVPCSMIPLLWNCIMSVGGGWFFLTASEMISVNSTTYALPGIGSFVAVAAEHQELGKIGAAIVVMAIVVLAIDFLLWKPLTAWAEKFRITQSGSVEEKRSAVLTLLRRSHISEVLGRVLTPVGDVLDRAMRVLGVTGAVFEATGSRRRAGDAAWGVIVAAIVAFGVVQMGIAVAEGAGFGEIGHALVLGLITFARVVVLTVVCSVIWVPVGVLIGMNERLARFVQPVIQVLASFPANFTFPFVVMLFTFAHIGLGIGSTLLMALGTQWYILFNVIAGASAIPDDMRELARSLRMPARLCWTKIYLPAVLGAWCTGGITAAGGAWNASIVSEVVTYGGTTLTATGLGSYIAAATAAGDMSRTVIGVAVMSFFVVAVNRLFWRRIEHVAEHRFSLN